MKSRNLVFIFIPIMLRILSVALFKLAAISMTHFTFWKILTNELYLLCLFIYFLIALSWQYALRFFPLSVAYSFQSLVLVGLLFVGYYFFDEDISVYNMAGSLLVIAGVIQVTRNANHD